MLCYASQSAGRINLQFIHNNIKIVVIINDKTKTMKCFLKYKIKYETTLSNYREENRSILYSKEFDN